MQEAVEMLPLAQACKLEGQRFRRQVLWATNGPPCYRKTFRHEDCRVSRAGSLQLPHVIQNRERTANLTRDGYLSG